jgi:hypothetical protein
MDNIKNVPEQKRSLLQQLIGQLSRVAGIEAIVLGGRIHPPLRP